MPQSPSLRRWCGECTKQASCITKRWKNLENSLFLSFFARSIGIRAKPPDYWECTAALSFANFESCTLTSVLSAMPNAVPRMAFAHTSRTETSDDVFGNESARSLLSGLPQNLKEEICYHCPVHNSSEGDRCYTSLHVVKSDAPSVPESHLLVPSCFLRRHYALRRTSELSR